MNKAATTDPAFEKQLEDILVVLAEVAGGNLGKSLPRGLDPASPVGALSAGINAVIDAWRQAELKARSTKKELEAKLGTIEAQAAAIRELSTPVMEIWDDTLLLPIVGVLDSHRSLELMETLLKGIVDRQARHVILDITGVEVVDTKTADYVLKVVRAAKLLGARCVLTGLSPAVAQTLVEIGADLNEVSTLRSLKDALREVTRRSESKAR